MKSRRNQPLSESQLQDIRDNAGHLTPFSLFVRRAEVGDWIVVDGEYPRANIYGMARRHGLDVEIRKYVLVDSRADAERVQVVKVTSRI